jgi:hypothetical protein
MGKGSGRRPTAVTDKEMEKAWNAIWAGHPNEEQFETIKQKPPVVKEDDYGNELPKTNDPDRFVDDIGDA